MKKRSTVLLLILFFMNQTIKPAITFLKQWKYSQKFAIGTVDNRSKSTFTAKNAAGNPNKMPGQRTVSIKPGKVNYSSIGNADFPTSSDFPSTFDFWVDQNTILKQPPPQIMLEGKFTKKDGSIGGMWNIVLTLLQEDNQMIVVLDSNDGTSILSSQILNLQPLVSIKKINSIVKRKPNEDVFEPSQEFYKVFLEPQIKMNKIPKWLKDAYEKNDLSFLKQVQLNLIIYPFADPDWGRTEVDSVNLSFAAPDKAPYYGATHTINIKINDLITKAPGIVSPVMKPPGITDYVKSQLGY